MKYSDSTDIKAAPIFTATATTEIYTLSLHDALPISDAGAGERDRRAHYLRRARGLHLRDRKSTRLNSSHTVISYAVFCLKKKKMSSNRSVLPPRQYWIPVEIRARRADLNHLAPASQV